MPCGTFEDAFQAVVDGDADLAMIPIDNSVAGRVADIHHLLPRSNLYIIGEHFLPVHHQLMIVPETDASRDQVGAQPCPCAGPVPQGDPRTGHQAGRRRRHGGCRTRTVREP